MKLLKLVWHVTVITLALYAVRPIEALYLSTSEAYYAFVDKFSRVWAKEGWESLRLYKEAWSKFKE